MGNNDKVIDISDLERPAAGTQGVPLPESGMAEPELVDALDVDEGPQAARSEGTYEKPVTAHEARPVLTRAPLQDHQKHAVAMAIVSGMPNADIAGMVRHTPKYMKTQIAEDPAIAEYVNHYTSLRMRAMVEHQFNMYERMDKANAVLDDALVDNDIRVRFMAMEKVYKSVDAMTGIGSKTGASGPLVELNFPGTDPEANRALTEVMSGVKELLGKMQSGEFEVASVNKHIAGDLPGPEVVIGHTPRAGNG